MASIRKRKDSWQAQVRRAGRPLLTKTFKNKNEAVAWARATEVEIDGGRAPITIRELKHFTLGDLVCRYRDHVVSKKRCPEIETVLLNAFLRHPQLANRRLPQMAGTTGTQRTRNNPFAKAGLSI